MPSGVALARLTSHVSRLTSLVPRIPDGETFCRWAERAIGAHSYRQSSLIPDTGWRHVSMNFSASSQANALADGATSFTFYKQGGEPIDGDWTHFFHNTNDISSSYSDFHAFLLTSNGSGYDMFRGVADEFRVRGENSTA